MTYALYNGSSGGFGGLFSYAQSIVPFFDALLFGVILLVVTFSIYFTQESKKGRGDFPVAFAVGCTSTTVLATILSLLAGAVSSYTLGILIALTIVSYIWLFYSEP